MDWMYKLNIYRKREREREKGGRGNKNNVIM